MDQMLVSKTLGVELMGYYSMATDISSLPAEFVYPTMGPIYSGYADLLDRESELNNAFITVIGVISVLSFPLYLGLFYLSEELVTLILGPKWLTISELIQIMSILILMQILCTTFTGFLTVKGKVKLLTTLDWLFIFVLIPLLFFASTFGSAVIIVVGRLIPYVFLSTALFFFTCTGVAGMAERIISVAIRPMLAGLLMPILLFQIHPYIADLNIGLNIAINVALGAFFYSLIIWLLWIMVGRKEGGERFILAKLGLLLNRRRK